MPTNNPIDSSPREQKEPSAENPSAPEDDLMNFLEGTLEHLRTTSATVVTKLPDFPAMEQELSKVQAEMAELGTPKPAEPAQPSAQIFAKREGESATDFFARGEELRRALRAEAQAYDILADELDPDKTKRTNPF